MTLRFLLAAVLAFPSAGLSAQTVLLPEDVQYPLLAKILTFDRRLEVRTGDEIVLGIIFQQEFPPSHANLLALEAAAARSPIRSVHDLPVRLLPVRLDQVQDLPAQLRREGVNLVYLAPVRAVDIQRILDAARTVGALTVTGVPEYVAQGVSVGMGLRNSRPRILINLSSARLEGADLTASLLSLAEVIR